MRNFLLAVMSVMFCMAIFGCRKGELPVPQYYGSVQVELKSVPGTDPVDVYYNGKKLFSLASSNGNSSIGKADIIAANAPGLLSFKKANTDSIIADSSIVVGKDQNLTFTIVNSSEFGLKGFFSSRPVAADSLNVQFLLKLNAHEPPIENLKFYVVEFNGDNGDILRYADSVPVFKNGDLSKVISLPFNDADGNYINYAGMFVDPVTNEPIMQPNVGFPLLFYSATQGAHNIITLSGDVDNVVTSGVTL